MNKDWLKLVRTWLHQEVVPIAEVIDCQPEALKTVLEAMGDLQLLALKVPVELGGAGLSELDYRQLQILMARCSGALTFLQTQHQSALAMLAKSQNTYLQQDFLANVMQKNMLIGVGFSHLRRLGKPMMQATATTNGYLFAGEVPWITGYQFFDYFICGAALEDGREIYGVLPLQNQSQAKGKIVVSQAMELIAVSSTNTVSATVHNWFVPSHNIVGIKPSGSIHVSSRRNILNHGFFALGCAYAGIDIIRQIAAKKQLDFLDRAWQSLQLEAEQGEKKAISFTSCTETAWQQKLRLRAELIHLAQRCSQAAVIAASGAANYLNSSAGRVYREALLFSVSGQTTEVMAASLERLLN